MATEDEEQMNGAGGDALAAATASVPTAAPAAPAAQPNMAAPAAGGIGGGGQTDLSALNAATQNLAPGQSVQDAGMGAVEASVTAAAQETRDRMRAGRDGIESPPSQWAQDVNNLFTGLTSAARRAAERIYQPQTQQVQKEPQVQPEKQPQKLSVGKNGRVLVGNEPDNSDPLAKPISAATALGSTPPDEVRFNREIDSIFGF